MWPWVPWKAQFNKMYHYYYYYYNHIQHRHMDVNLQEIWFFSEFSYFKTRWPDSVDKEISCYIHGTNTEAVTLPLSRECFFLHNSMSVVAAGLK